MTRTKHELAPHAHILLWRKAYLDLGKDHIDVNSYRWVLKHLKQHTIHLTVIVPKGKGAQLLFRRLIQAVRDRPLVSLVFEKSYLDKFSYTYLESNLSGREQVWITSLRQLQLPFSEGLQGAGSCTELLENGVRFQIAGSDHTTVVEAPGSYQRGLCTSPHGTPVSILRTIVGCLDHHARFENVIFDGNRSSPNSLGNSVSSLQNMALSNKLSITTLELNGLDFSDITFNGFKRVDLAHVQHLHIRDCYNLPHLFQYFMESDHPIGIKTFQCYIFLVNEEAWYEHPHNINKFLLSFSSLETLKIHVHPSWELELAKISTKHNELNCLECCIGTENLPMSSIGETVRALPSLRSLTFQFSLPKTVVETGIFDKAPRKVVKDLSAILNSCYKLEEITIVMEPPKKQGKFNPKDNAGKKGGLQIVADHIHELVPGLNRVAFWIKTSKFRSKKDLFGNSLIRPVFYYSDNGE